MNVIFLRPKNINELRVVESAPIPSVTSVDCVAPLVIKLNVHDSIAILDKKKAHGLFEVMMMQTGKSIKKGIDELSNEEYELSMEIIQLFGKFINDNKYVESLGLEGSIPRVSFNYDPFTLDRDSLQDVKRFHVHMFLISSETLRFFEANTRSYSNILSMYQRRRIVDPFSFVAEQILFDLHNSGYLKLPAEMELIQVPFEEKVYKGDPLGLNILITRGWEFIRNEKFRNYLLDLHNVVKRATNKIYLALTGENVQPRFEIRYNMLDYYSIKTNLDNLNWLSKKSRDALMQIAKTLRPFPTKLIRSRNKHKLLVNHHVLANGPAFTVSLYSDEPIASNKNEEYLQMNVSVRLLSDIGGAGLFGCRGISGIYLDRNCGAFSNDEMAKRQRFQKMFQSYVKQNIKRSMYNLPIEQVKNLFSKF